LAYKQKRRKKRITRHPVKENWKTIFLFSQQFEIKYKSSLATIERRPDGKSRAHNLKPSEIFS
jgi:hypothetical protein